MSQDNYYWQRILLDIIREKNQVKKCNPIILLITYEYLN